MAVAIVRSLRKFLDLPQSLPRWNRALDWIWVPAAVLYVGAQVLGLETRTPTDLNASCHEYLRLVYHGLRAKDRTFNATLKPEFDPGLPPVAVIAQDLGRVLLNLLTNAFCAVK